MEWAGGIIIIYISNKIYSYIEYILNNNNIIFIRNNLVHFKGVDFFDNKIKCKCIVAFFDRSQPRNIDYDSTSAEDEVLVIRYGFPTIFFVDSKNNEMIDNLKLLKEGNDKANYILLQIIDLDKLIRHTEQKILQDLEKYEKDIEEGFEDPTRIQSLAMEFLRGLLNRHGINPIFDSKYLFSWSKIPGNDNDILMKYLDRKYHIDWMHNARIYKSENGKIVRISQEHSIISLILNNEDSEVLLKKDNVIFDKFNARMENNELSIYQI